MAERHHAILRHAFLKARASFFGRRGSQLRPTTASDRSSHCQELPQHCASILLFRQLLAINLLFFQ
eukprot:1807848-Prorocentrum_lima.AAC.1